MEADLITITSSAPVKGRKWLALKYVAISLLTNTVMWWGMDVLDSGDHVWREIPRWAQYLVVMPVVAGFYGLGYLLLRGTHDVLIHTLRPGNLKTKLVGDEESVAKSAAEFPEMGRAAAYGPLMVLGCYLVLAFFAILILGGLAAVVAVWSGLSAMTAGWPSWAIVIVVLLVLILFKDNGRRD